MFSKWSLYVQSYFDCFHLWITFYKQLNINAFLLVFTSRQKNSSMMSYKVIMMPYKVIMKPYKVIMKSECQIKSSPKLNYPTISSDCN